MRNGMRWAVAVWVAVLLFAAVGASAQGERIALRYVKVTMTAGKAAVMGVQVRPASAKDRVIWASSDENVATVSASGRIQALKAGTTTVRATLGSAKAQCRVTVKPPKITKVALNAKKVALDLSSGTHQLSATVFPSGADAGALRWISSNRSVANVSASGLVTFKKAGAVSIAAVAPSGKRAVCAFQVKRSDMARRALVVGEGRANANAGLTALPMAASEVNSIAAMFRKNGIATTTLVNGTRAGLLGAIQSAFSGAASIDVNYLYITCHGGVDRAGVYRLYPCGDGYLTAAQLRAALSKVAGKVVIMLGSCESGNVIAKGAADGADGMDTFLTQFMGATAKSGEFLSSKYQVLCACRGSEKGYGVITQIPGTGEIVEEGTYNFFGRAVAEGGAGAADLNQDGAITLSELHGYVKGRVSQLHAQWRDKIGLSVKDTQTVVAYPASSDFVVFN